MLSAHAYAWAPFFVLETMALGTFQCSFLLMNHEFSFTGRVEGAVADSAVETVMSAEFARLRSWVVIWSLFRSILCSGTFHFLD